MRVGIDIDGVLADMAGAAPPAPAGPLPADFWESLDEIEPGMVKRLAETADAEGWDVFFLTKRPETSGAPAQVQTERWLERHGFARPRVQIVRGSRGKVVHQLGLDLLIDDSLDNCLDTALQSKAASILIWKGDAVHARRSLRGMNVDIAESLGDSIERLTGRALERERRSTVAPPAGVSSVAIADPPKETVRLGPIRLGTIRLKTDAPLTRPAFAMAALVFGAFAIYGSLVPLEFQAISFTDALDRYSRVPYLQLGIQSRADFVANILLFVPLAFLLMGALRVDQRGRVAATIAGAFVSVFAFVLANAIEFTQIYFPMRTVSQNDIIAETTGALIGVGLWGLLGQRLTGFLRGFLAERERSGLIVRLLAAYTAGFFVSQVLPLDIAITPGELAEKYHAGRIIIVPFTYAYASPLLMLWDLISDIALNVPVGALAVLGWTAANRRRGSIAAASFGMGFVAVMEIAQLFIYSRYSDTTDLLTGAIGVFAGIALATRNYAPADRRSGFRLWPALAAIAWACGLAAYHWYPFDFVVSGAMADAQLPLLLAVPFRHYYFGSEFHAFSELSRKLMLSAPLGALLWMALPAVQSGFADRLKGAALCVAAFLFFAGLEAGQVFLPGRIPDLTDACVGAMGVAAGIWLVRLFERPRYELAIPRHVDLRH
jgi:VanZ family protein